MTEQLLRDPPELKRRAENDLRELAVALEREGVQESIITDVDRLKSELSYLTDDVIDEEGP